MPAHPKIMNKQVAIKDLLPNPFRKIERYPIQRAKVEALKESFQKTTFWDNCVARIKNNQVELAYGHHRRQALLEYYQADPDHKVGIIIRELSDETMIQIMANENMEEWGTNSAVEQETIRTVVEAYAEGKIKLGQPGFKMAKADMRYAPSFIKGQHVICSGISHPYTAVLIASFLGWDKQKVQTILAALELIEEGILAENQFQDRNITKSRNLVRETSRRKEAREKQAKNVEKEAEQAEDPTRKQYLLGKAQELKQQAKTEAKLVGQKIQDEVGSGRRGAQEARQLAEQVLPPLPKSEREPPDINKFASTLAGQIRDLLNDDSYSAKLIRLTQFRGNLLEGYKRELVAELNRLSKRAAEYAQDLNSPIPPSTNNNNRKALSNVRK